MTCPRMYSQMSSSHDEFRVPLWYRLPTDCRQSDGSLVTFLALHPPGVDHEYQPEMVPAPLSLKNA